MSETIKTPNRIAEEYESELTALRAKLAEAERDAFDVRRWLKEWQDRAEAAERRAESLDKLLCRLEDAATAIHPYPESYRPNAYEAAIQLPDELRKAEAKLAAVREQYDRWMAERQGFMQTLMAIGDIAKE